MKKKFFLLFVALISLGLVAINYLPQEEKRVVSPNQSALTTLVQPMPEINAAEVKPFSMPTTQQTKNRILDNTKKLLSLKDKNLDSAVLSFLNNPKISRSEKIATFLTALNEVGFDSDKGKYFADVLESLKPIEIADKLMNQFQSGNLSDNAKNSILRILANSYGLDPAKSSPETAKLIAQKSIAVQEFFTQQIQNPASKEVFKQAIKLYPSVSSENETALLNDALMKHQDLISISEGLNIRLDSALATQNMQENNLPQLLKSVQNTPFNAAIKQDFNNRLFSYLKEPNAEAVVQDIAKPSVANYIKSQEPPLKTTNTDFNSLNDYYAWLDSYAAMSSGQSDRKTFVADYATKSATPIQQAAVIVFADNNLVSELQKNPIIQTNLQKELANPQLTVEAKQVIQDAIGRLNQQ